MENCEHNWVTNCDGDTHITVCSECWDVQSIEPCPEAGTWPTEEDSVFDGVEGGPVFVV